VLFRPAVLQDIPGLVLPGRTTCQNLQGQKSESPWPGTGAVKPVGPYVLLRKEDSLEDLYMRSGERRL